MKNLTRTTFRVIAETHALIARCKRAKNETAALLEQTRKDVASARETLRRMPPLATSPEVAGAAWIQQAPEI